ncbi:zf-HC2 domain-containing protein [Bacillus tianshenii]|uniref:sigma factor n=1 Tax=Sutcliffiella tianshenii TaxID=1463404 RepID=UPI001CD1B2FB|nr:sigma factor [Bacillus tianshenii]MCA1319200.1 zf-HC2 domain-containing protein [Bacillus tianshenii]
MIEETVKVKSILDGNKDAYDSIIERYKNRLYAVTLRMAGSEGEAERLVEKSFIAAYDRLATYDEKDFFSDWLYRQTLTLIKSEVASCGKTTPEDYIQFYNPRFLEIEEAIANLESNNRFEFLLHHALAETPEKLAVFLDEQVEDIKGRYQQSLKAIRGRLLEFDMETSSEECLSFDELIRYFDGNLRGDEKEKVEDHLEFCPSCREVLTSLKAEKRGLEDVIHTPKLEEDFNRRVLNKLTPYVKKVPKHRTWKYQLGVIGIMAAIFMIGAVVVPNLKPLANKVAAYIEYGTIYNVWTEGTYKATDEDLSFEIKGVDIDPLHMVVYYETRRNDKPLGNFMDFDFFEPNAVQLLDENGKKYPIEVSQPISSMFYNPRGNETDEPQSFVIKAIEEDKLPDKFVLKFNFRRMQTITGNWEVEVPIRYDKVENNLKVVELNEVKEIDGKIEVEFLTMIYGKHGSRLTYHVRLKEEEKKRLENLLKETRDGDHVLERYQNAAYANIQLLNQEGQYMVPIYYHSQMMEWNPGELITQDYSLYHYDYEDYQNLGKTKGNGPYFADVRDINYHEPSFVSLSLPLEEAENKPLNIELEGLTLKDLTVRHKDNGDEDDKSYQILINAVKNQGKSEKQFHWRVVGENGEYLELHYMGNHIPPDIEGEFELLNAEIFPRGIQKEMEKVTLQAEGAYNFYMFDEGELRIPLFEEE